MKEGPHPAATSRETRSALSHRLPRAPWARGWPIAGEGTTFAPWNEKVGLGLRLRAPLTAELLCSRPSRESPRPLLFFVLFHPARKMNLLVSVELPWEEVGPEREPLLLPSAGQKREQE